MVNPSASRSGKPSVSAQSVDFYLRRYSELEDIKRPWLVHYQALAEIFLTRKMDFTRMMVPGQFLQADVFDNTGQFAAYLFASVCLSMIWPDAGRTVVIKPARRLKAVPGVDEYFRYVTDEVREAMDNPKAGLTLALMEHMIDQGIFGTSGVSSFEGDPEDPNLPVVYDSWSIKTMCIAENAQGFVDTVYYKRQLTVRQIVEEYDGSFEESNDRVAPKVLEQYRDQKFDDKVDVVYVIEPKVPEKGKEGVAGMRVRTVHIDSTNRFMMREGGVEEMPVHVGRFFKTMDEPYARSSGMLALPDAQSLNVMTEAVLVASEKQLDPPLAVLDDGRLGGGVVNTGAGELTVFNTAGRPPGGDKPIFPLFTVGESQSADKQQTRLEQKIMQAFFLDRLLDLNNQTQMTAYETSIRNRIRGEALGSIFARQQKEVLTPVVERTFNILYRRGQLGIVNTGIGARLRALWAKITGAKEVVVPAAVVAAAQAGLNVFEVEYISPAARFMQAEKLQGVFTAVDSIVALQPVMPSIVDRIDPDLLVEDIYELGGTPNRSLRTMDATKKLREAMQARQDTADKLAAAEQLSKVAVNSASARATMGAVSSPGQPVGGRN